MTPLASLRLRRLVFAAACCLGLVGLLASPGLADGYQFLGRLGGSPYAPDSTANPYGRFGSAFSPSSIQNPFGRYGSKFSPQGVRNPYTTGGPKIFGADGQYLGRLNANRFDPESVSNPFGRYGSRFSPTSINNPFGRYGSRFSPYSPNNPFATQPPVVIGK